MTARAGLVYGVGALRAAARGDRIMWAVHRAALANGIVPVVPVAAIAEAFRTEARGDRLEALLSGAEVEDLDDEGARRAGELAARADTADLVAVATARGGGPSQLRGGGLPPARAAHGGGAPRPRPRHVRRLSTASASVGGDTAEPAQGAGEGALDPEQLGGQVVLLAGPGLLGQGGHPPGELVEGGGEGGELGARGHLPMMAHGPASARIAAPRPTVGRWGHR